MNVQGRTEFARVSEPLQGGRGWPFGSPIDVGRRGCVMEEFLIEGVAVSYAPAPGSTIGLDGYWDTEPAATAPYRSRMYVVRPADPDRFNGVVLVNWQNVTAGVDLGAPASYDLDHGYAWVGITTQRVAIEGQPSLAAGLPETKGLPAWDPQRYGSLQHPGDAFSYDIFSQGARAVGPARPTLPVDPLGGLAPRLIIATGGSQSAMRLGSYLNIADQGDAVFDGFFLLVHWGMCPYPPDQSLMESFTSIGQGLTAGSAAIADRHRVPVLVLNSESETMNVYPVRQEDSGSFRFWEMAGTAHTGANVGDMDAVMARDGLGPIVVSEDRNLVDWSYVRNAALEHLVSWASGGPAPGSFPPIEIDDSSKPAIRRDGFGNALGGIRLPDLVVPTATHSGTNMGNPVAALAGQSTPLRDHQLQVLYPDRAAFENAWDAAVDELLTQALVLASDLPAVRDQGEALADRRWGTRTD
jgi:hypothetical protein